MQYWSVISNRFFVFKASKKKLKHILTCVLHRKAVQPHSHPTSKVFHADFHFCKEFFFIFFLLVVESAPPFGLGSNKNLALRSFAQLRMPRDECAQLNILANLWSVQSVWYTHPLPAMHSLLVTLYVTKYSLVP